MADKHTILKNVDITAEEGKYEDEVTGIFIDSRKVKAGSCFIAMRGTIADGHLHIDDAVDKGAKVVVCEQFPEQMKDDVAYARVENTAHVAGQIADNYYEHPSSKVKLVGVTGTNGKTTIATLLFKLFSSMGYQCGLISTVQNQIGSVVTPSTHTTPDAVSLNELLAKMVEAGCTYVFMEVSSHAIHQGRIRGLEFAGGIFSNITHDHLDYHKTFDEYIRVKKSFFDDLPSSAFAISNADDRRGAVMLQNTGARKFFYALKTLSDFKGKILENSIAGLLMNINDTEVHFKLIGTFNAYNLLAVYAAAVCLGEDKQKALQFLSNLSGAEGRFDYIVSPKEKVIGIIDYAHTPDALLNVLTTIKNLKKGYEQVITVVGCGGDRDKTKRPIMAEVTCQHSDKIIFTSDNPRSEDPGQILKEMEVGVSVSCRRKYIAISDRREAIKAAVSFAGKEDIILVAGKGHEKYQDIKGIKYPFDDKQVLLEMFELLEK